MRTIAFDIETYGEDKQKRTAFDRKRGKIFAYAICNEKGQTQVYRDTDDNFESTLEEIFYSGEYRIVAHKVKFDLGFMYYHFNQDERILNIPFEDTLLAFKVLWSNHYSHALDDLAFDLGRYPRGQDKEVSKWLKGKRKVTYRDVPVDIMTKYQIADVKRGMLLWKFAEGKLNVDSRHLNSYKWEKDLVVPTMFMEDYGSRICPIRCNELINKLRGEMDGCKTRIRELTGNQFTPGTKKWSEYLKEIGIHNEELTDTGNMKLDKHLMLKLRSDTNEKFVHIKEGSDVNLIKELADINLKYKTYQMTVGRIKTFLEIKDNENTLHPTINTCEADTGRESVTNPALQNIGKSKVLLSPYAVPMRNIFVVRDGKFNIHIDFAGQEKRLLVHYSGEDELVKIINEKGDMHLPSCEAFYGERFINADAPTKKTLRDAAKNGGFAIDYGAGVETYAQTVGEKDIEEAQKQYDGYKARFRKLGSLYNNISKQVRFNSCIWTAFDKQLMIPKNLGHIGLNYLIQGTAAQQIKRAQVLVHRYLKSVNSPIKMILPVHDELILDCPINYSNKVIDFKEICRIMVDFGDIFKVPFEVELSITKDSWETKKKCKTIEELQNV